MKLPLLLLSVATLIAFLPSAELPAAEKSLVENGSFDESGDDAVPKWKVRRIARLTDFRTEGGRLVAERKAGSSPSADTVHQILYLPEDTRAIQVRIDAETERLLHAEVTVRFVRRDGGSAGRKKVFHLAGTRKKRTYDKDVLLPEGAKDVEISIRICAEGRLVVDEVQVRPIAIEDARDEARVVELRGSYVVKLRNQGRMGGQDEPAPPADGTRITIPLPPPTETQSPCRVEIRSEPAGRLVKATVERDAGLDTADLTLDGLTPESGVRISFVARVVVTEREGMRDLPESVEISPARHLGPRLQAFAKVPTDAFDADARRVAGDTEDLFVLAEGVRKAVRGVSPTANGEANPFLGGARHRLSTSGRANLAAIYFRENEVPARAAALVSIGDAATLEHCVVAYQKELGWLRFSLSREGPLRLPFADHVLLRAGPAEKFIALENAESAAPAVVENELIEGPSGGTLFSAREIGSLTLPAGAGPDLIAGVAKGWDRACREFDEDESAFTVNPSRLSLSGRARKLKKPLAEILSE